MNKKKEPEPEIVYVYSGKERGIPGLPNRVTRAEAIALQAEKELNAALESGIFIEEKTDGR